MIERTDVRYVSSLNDLDPHQFEDRIETRRRLDDSAKCTTRVDCDTATLSPDFVAPKQCITFNIDAAVDMLLFQMRLSYDCNVDIVSNKISRQLLYCIRLSS